MSQVKSTFEVRDKIDSCPICQTKLIQESNRLIICPACGLKVVVRTRNTDDNLTIILMYVLAGVFVLGIVLGWLLRGIR